MEPNALLELAKNADLEEVLIFGFCKDGDSYISTSTGKLRDANWLIDAAKDVIWQELA